MMEISDPSINPVPLPPANEVQGVEPIKPETVSIQEERLENRQSRDEENGDRRRKRKKDVVELSNRNEMTEDDETVEESGRQARDDQEQEHTIDIRI